MELVYEVAVDAALATTLTYSQPTGRETPLPVGCCVQVPLGRRSAVGYILGPAQKTEEPQDFVIKPVHAVLSEAPLFPAELLPFYRWIARYYHYPLGEVLRTALPLQPTSRSRGRVNARMQEVLSPGPALADFLATLQPQNESPDEGDVERFLDRLEEVSGASFLKSDQRVLTLFVRASAASPGQPVPRSLINRQYSGAKVALDRLLARQILTNHDQRIFRDPFGDPPPFFAEPSHLTDEQQQVLGAINRAIDAHTFSPFLLFGVTGCGKTEVYLQAVRRVLDQGRTALVLVPEIALASQLEAHFYSRFGDRLAVLHSGLSDGERYDQWQRVADGAARVVLGARSAIFAPLTNLGIVVVDEEHEPAYKQDDGLRYSGRDLAVLRAQMAGCPVVLGSATPSILSYHHCREGKYQLLTMPHRIAHQTLPRVEIVDLTNLQKSRPDLSFTDPLIHELGNTLEMNKQSLLFVNRRGFSSAMLCRDCGAVVQCRHCQVSLTLHRQRNILLCHYCGYSQPANVVCPACGSTRVQGVGMGSERIEEEVSQLFPEARVARLDSDTTASRRHYLQTLKQMREGQIDILIGTQMIAKGLHFPGIRLVGVVWADSALSLPDYKASERTFSLLSQVTGRAGRGSDPGMVIIQTYQPRHYAVQCAQHHDYEGFYAREIATRKILAYPPFSRLVNICFSGSNANRVEESARRVAAFIRSHGWNDRLEVLGPAPAPLVKIRNKTRWQLLLKSSHQAVLHGMCDILLDNKKIWNSNSIRMILDVDPENMM